MARITDKIKEKATEENAAIYQASSDPRAFCIDLMEINPAHPNLYYFVEKMEAAFAKITGQPAPKSANPVKGNANASYIIKGEAGTAVAEVSVSWSRKYGKCDQRNHSRHSTLYTQKALRAWSRRNKVDIPESDIKMLPKEI